MFGVRRGSGESDGSRLAKLKPNRRTIDDHSRAAGPSMHHPCQKRSSHVTLRVPAPSLRPRALRPVRAYARAGRPAHRPVLCMPSICLALGLLLMSAYVHACGNAPMAMPDANTATRTGSARCARSPGLACGGGTPAPTSCMAS